MWWVRYWRRFGLRFLACLCLLPISLIVQGCSTGATGGGGGSRPVDEAEAGSQAHVLSDGEWTLDLADYVENDCVWVEGDRVTRYSPGCDGTDGLSAGGRFVTQKDGSLFCTFAVQLPDGGAIATYELTLDRDTDERCHGTLVVNMSQPAVEFAQDAVLQYAGAIGDVEPPPVVECEGDTDCDGNLVCDEGRCVEAPAPLPEDEDVGAPDPSPDPNAECGGNADCAESEICEDGECVGIDCAEDGDCADGEICEYGMCFLVACVQDEDCADWEICDSGECVEAEFGCLEDTDCAVDEICEDGECVVWL
ncbi:MAG: hypothetical protein GY842_27595 [bacterium]|nr:hypothetical protein [bacterium]